MKKLFLWALVLGLIISCAGQKEAVDPVRQVYLEKLNQIMRYQKKPTADVFEICEEILPDIVKSGNLEDYRKVIPVYKKNDDTFNRSMTYNYLANIETSDPVLSDSLYFLSQDAAILVMSTSFREDLAAYYGDRGFTDDELNDRLSAYRAMIRDTYAQKLIKKQKLEKAIDLYDDIITNYQSTEILMNYGKALRALNRYEASLRVMIQALNMTPGSLEAKSQIQETATMLGYSQAEIKSMVDETVFFARNIMRENLLADRVDLPMPEFTLQGIDSTLVNSSDLEDKVTIISFFATWCPPCREELPQMNETYLQYKDDPEVRFIIASTDQEKYLVTPFINNLGYKFPVYYADGIQREFGVKGIPSLFVIDKKGMIRYKKVGYDRGEEFNMIMSWYIEELKIGIDS